MIQKKKNTTTTSTNGKNSKKRAISKLWLLKEEAERRIRIMYHLGPTDTAPVLVWADVYSVVRDVYSFNHTVATRQRIDICNQIYWDVCPSSREYFWQEEAPQFIQRFEHDKSVVINTLRSKLEIEEARYLPENVPGQLSIECLSSQGSHEKTVEEFLAKQEESQRLRSQRRL